MSVSEPLCGKCGERLIAFQPWSTAILFCPRCSPSRIRLVTGPGGDNPITDEQIRELRARELRAGQSDDTGPVAWDCTIALGETRTRRRRVERDAARTRCAAAYNARHVGKEGR